MHPYLLSLCGLLVLTVLFVLGVVCKAVFSRRHKYAAFRWTNKYPSIEELHAFFDRGDIILSSVLIASTLQLSHPRTGATLKAHSTYKTDPWRRLARTLGFIYIVIRSRSLQREHVIRWLRGLHGNIALYTFENNLVVFATFAYALIMTHRAVGQLTKEQEDAIVRGVLSLADKLNPGDMGRRTMASMPELEEYLIRELPDMYLGKTIDDTNALSIWMEMKHQGFWPCLRHPFSFLQLVLLKKWAGMLARVTISSHSRPKSPLARLGWSLVRSGHRVLLYFHYALCPTMLTFGGLLRIIASNPRLEKVLMEEYEEIFPDKDSLGAQFLAEVDGRGFAGVTTHLPSMNMPGSPEILRSIMFETEITDIVKSAYYRTSIAREVDSVPQHLGIIMDGNRRYSKKKQLGSSLLGHEAGAIKLLQVITWAFSSGVTNLTLWGMSDDNLKRGPQELEPLFSMMTQYIRETIVGQVSFSIPGVRFRVVGDRSLLSKELNEAISAAEIATANNTDFNLQLALGYGGRSETLRAIKHAISHKIQNEQISVQAALDSIDEADISRHLYSQQLRLPHIDAVMRTSGEKRLSGFALWESQHAEFSIVQENWPALTQSTFLKQLLDLARRNRRFGA